MTGPYTAIIISALASLIWIALLVRTVRSRYRDQERRVISLVMPIVGLMASLGTLSSAFAYLVAVSPDIEIGPEGLTLVASMGRGALLMGGIMAFALYGPGERHS